MYFFEAVPNPAIGKRGSITQNIPLPPKFKEIEDEVDSIVQCTRSAMETSPRTRTKPKPKTEPKGNSSQSPRETDGHTGNDSGKPRKERMGLNPDWSPNRRATQAKAQEQPTAMREQVRCTTQTNKNEQAATKAPNPSNHF